MEVIRNMANRRNRIIKPIDYTARDFDSIKERLVDYVKNQYPDTYKDFNASSFGSLMFDLVAYVGDSLAYYTDYIANETNPMTSVDEDTTNDHFVGQGAKPYVSNITHGIAQMYFPCPANAANNDPDFRYLQAALSSVELRTEGGATFTVRDNISLNDTTVEFVGEETADIDGSKVTFYIVKTDVPVISGQIGQFALDIAGQARKFQKAIVPALNCTEIIKIEDKEGNNYFEVDYLPQNTVYRAFANVSTQNKKVPSIMKAYPVPRRFITEKQGKSTSIVFGYGSEDDLKTNVIADPAGIAVEMHGKDYISDTSFDIAKLVSTGQFGVAPSNTTLNITYRYNENINANAAAGTINQVVNAVLDFDDEPNLDTSKIEYMRNNLQVYNEEPINGDITIPNTEEIRRRGMGVAAMQKRAVTLQDYVSATYSMPQTLGAIKRCAVIRDNNDLRRNINLYVVAEGADGKFEKASQKLKENVKTHMNQVRMISDSIDIFDATIINLGLEFDVVPKEGVTMKTLSIELRRMLYEEMTAVPPDIGEHFYLAEIFALLQNHNDVLTVNNVRAKCLSGQGYSDVFYNIEDNISPGKKFVYIPENFVWEIKNESDIKARQ